MGSKDSLGGDWFNLGDEANVFYPSKKTVCTQVFSNFLHEYHASLDFFFFVVHVVANADRARVQAAKALVDVAKGEAEREDLKKSSRDEDRLSRQLQKYSSVQSRNLTNGIVGSFQRYFSSIIQCAAIKKPALLTSSTQTVGVDDILRFTRHKDLVAFIVDKKINDLSYGGLADMEHYFANRLGVQMFESDRQRELLKFFIEVRNINVHNGGIVNELFLSRVSRVDGFKFVKDRVFHIDMDSLVLLSGNAMQVALHIDSVVSAKFNLKRKAHDAWLREKGKVKSSKGSATSKNRKRSKP